MKHARPILRFNPTQFLLETSALSALETGAYLLLALHFFQHPHHRIRVNDIDMLARTAHVSTQQWKEIAPYILPLLDVENGKISCAWTANARFKAKQLSKTRSIAAHKRYDT